MNPAEQERFFQLEFSSWSQRFVRYATAMLIALIGVVLAQSFFANGGVDAQFLVYTFGLLNLGVGVLLLIFWSRMASGFRVGGITLIFLPWLALLAADAFVFSGTPWRAKYALAVNLLPLMAFFIALHTTRQKGTRWWTIALASIVVLISGIKTFLFPGEGAVLAQAGGNGFGATIRSVFGSLGGEVGIGAVLLLAFFPMALLVASAHFKQWARFFGLYMAVVFLAGIAFTRHVGAYSGLVIGGLLAVFLLVRSQWTRVVLLLALIGCGAFLATRANVNVGWMKTVPVNASVERTFSADERLAGTRYVLAHAAWEMFKEHPVFGVGSDRFSEEFEKYRPPQWQSTPKTAGSLVLQILAENGLVGAVLFFGPLAFLFARGVNVCAKMPWRTETSRSRLRSKMGVLDLGSVPEERIALAGTLSGLLAVFVLLCFDYPCRIPGVMLACAVFGGIAAFLMSRERLKIVTYSGEKRHFLCAGAFLAPVVLLFFFVPYFHAEAQFSHAAEGLKPFIAGVSTGTAANAEAPNCTRLKEAEAFLRSSLRKNPGHGDAWAMLAQKFVFDCQNEPDKVATCERLIRYASNRALECSTDVPAFFRLHAVAELMEGNYPAAKEDLARADSMAPFNASQLLLSAEIYRMCPDGLPRAEATLASVHAILPNSLYAERMLALLSLGGGEDDEAAGATDVSVPEF